MGKGLKKEFALDDKKKLTKAKQMIKNYIKIEKLFLFYDLLVEFYFFKRIPPNFR